MHPQLFSGYSEGHCEQDLFASGMCKFLTAVSKYKEQLRGAHEFGFSKGTELIQWIFILYIMLYMHMHTHTHTMWFIHLVAGYSLDTLQSSNGCLACTGEVENLVAAQSMRLDGCLRSPN